MMSDEERRWRCEPLSEPVPNSSAWNIEVDESGHVNIHARLITKKSADDFSRSLERVCAGLQHEGA